MEKWIAGLKEKAVRVKNDMVHPTRDDEATFLKARAEEAKKAEHLRKKTKAANKGKQVVEQTAEHTQEGASEPVEDDAKERPAEEDAKEHTDETNNDDDPAREHEDEEEEAARETKGDDEDKDEYIPPAYT